MSKDPWCLLTSRTLKADYIRRQAELVTMWASHHCRGTGSKHAFLLWGFTNSITTRSFSRAVQFLQTEPPISFLRNWLKMFRKRGREFTALPMSLLPQVVSHPRLLLFCLPKACKHFLSNKGSALILFILVVLGYFFYFFSISRGK